MYSNELYHHGRLHQRWGVKNGPPYPLSRSAVKQAYGSRKARKAAEKQAKAEREEAAKKEAEEKERARKVADKERVLREGTATEVLQYKNELTNTELQNVINRINYTNQLSNLSKLELDKGWNKVNDVMKKIGNVKDWTNTAVDLWKAVDNVMKIMDGQGELIKSSGKKKK